MTVAELISALAALNPEGDAEVLVSYFFTEFRSPELELHPDGNYDMEGSGEGPVVTI